ncbi:hypothetical protein [Nannocystis pusilla]|uniref:hypothetical protein n=1 Tax=Nannocystis pusilla TaxID=889268 RepID=UPI003DA2FE09
MRIAVVVTPSNVVVAEHPDPHALLLRRLQQLERRLETGHGGRRPQVGQARP